MSTTTVRRLVSTGQLVAVYNRSRRKQLIRRAYLDTWVQEHRVKPNSLAHLDGNRFPKYRAGTGDG